MKKDRWLKELDLALGSMEIDEKREIIRYYEEYFYDAVES